MAPVSKADQFDVFFYEAFAEERKLLKQFLPDSIRAGFAPETIQEAGHEQPPAKVISLRTQSQIPQGWEKQVDAILSRSTGYNHLLDYRERSAFNGQLGYLPLYCNRAVAEQAMMLWMSLLRKLPRQMEQFNTFSRDGLTGIECSGKTLLVVGVGNIGYQVVRIGRGLDMNVLGVDLVRKFDDVTYVPIDKGLPQADIVVASMNLTKRNRGYFHYDLLKKAKRGLIFVNIARGELSPLKDLYWLIKEKQLGGLALDVYQDESKLAIGFRAGNVDENDPYFKMIREMQAMPNVIFTPHNAFNTQESVLRKARHSVQQLEYYFREGRFLWVVPNE